MNKEFGRYISDVADMVILVGEKQTKPILEGLIDKHYDRDKIFVINDVRDAFKLVCNIDNKNVYVLLEMICLIYLMRGESNVKNRF